MQSQLAKGYIAAAVSAISFGLIPLFVVPAKQAGLSMDITLFYRFFLGAIMVAAFILLRKKTLRLPLRDIPKLMVMGIFYALSSEFLFWGYDLLSVGIASTVVYIYPLLIAVILSVFFAEKINTATRLSIFLAILGVAAMTWEGSSMQFNVKGLFIVLLGALAYALYMIMVSKANLQVRGLQLTCYSLFFSAVFYAGKSLITGQTLLLPSVYWVGFISAFSLVTTLISVLTMVIAIELIGSAPTAVLGSLEPVVAIGVSVLFFGEAITWNLIIGVLFVISALVVNVVGTQLRASGYRSGS